MGGQLLVLTIGFLLTGVLGAWLTSRFQKLAWERQHALQQRDQERQQALKTFEEVSTLLDKRLYRMRRLYWAARRKALGASGEADMKSARGAYDDILLEWNDNLNRILALVHAYFGGAVRRELEGGIYEGFARLHRGLDVIVHMVSGARSERIEVPRFGHRVTQLSNSVYALNVRMLSLLKEDRLGDRAPQEPPAKRVLAVKEPVLEIGDQGRAVRRLQQALRREGNANLDIDGIFGRETWTAVRSFQERRPLDVDGIVGPTTWAALPLGQERPLLRMGSQSEMVARLQMILAVNAPSRWSISPEAANGTFDATTSAAVKAFQRWNRLAADGVVGDQTWAAPVDETGVTLQSAVELE